jgi:poly(A) polymerase
LKRFMRLPGFEEHMELHRLDVLSSNRRLDAYDFVKHKLAEMPEEHLRPERLLTGADLIAAGYTPGPQFTEILCAVEDAQLEGLIHTAGEAMELVRERYPQ